MWCRSGRILVLSLCLAVVGCSGGSVKPEERVSAQTSYDSALTSFEGGDFVTAQVHFEDALKGELTVDLYTNALLKLSLCLANQKQFDQAMQRLSEAEQGADPEDIDAVRSQIEELKKG